MTKLLVGQSLELAEHVVPLTVEAVKQQIALRSCVDGHTTTLRPYEAYNVRSSARSSFHHPEQIRASAADPGVDGGPRWPFEVGDSDPPRGSR